MFFVEGVSWKYIYKNEVIMQLKQLVLVLIASSFLLADSSTGKRDSAAYLGAKQLDKDSLGSLVLRQNSIDPRIMQIKVVPQGAQGLTGLAATLQGSSCGYHAMKNGILFSQALLESSEKAHYLASLQSLDYTHFLFGGPQAPWRQFIMQQRFRTVARKIYREQIEKSLKQCSLEDRQLLSRCIHDLEVVDPVVSPAGFTYSADNAIVYSQLTQRMEKMMRQGSKHSIALKRLVEKLADYFGSLAIHFTIAYDGRCYDSNKTLSHVVGDAYGCWVSPAEIAAMVNYQRDEGLLQTHPDLLVATYGEVFGGAAEHASVSEKLSQLYTLVTETDDDVVGVVLVYLGGTANVLSLRDKITVWAKNLLGSFYSEAQQLQKNQDYGHWVSLVVSRIKGDMRYYLLDSLNSTRALSRSRIRDLIAIFDGKKELPGYQWTVGYTDSSAFKESKGVSLEVYKEDSEQSLSLNKTNIALGVGSISVAGLAYYYYQMVKPFIELGT